MAKPSVSPVAIDTVITGENVTYNFTQDANHFFLNIQTSDDNTIMSMLHLGVSVFFDIKGKKKENVYIKYPSEPVGLSDRRGDRERIEPENSEEDEEGKGQLIKEILENDYPQKAEYGYFDYQEEFHILLNSLGVTVSLTYDEKDGLLEYALKIPKNKTNLDSAKSTSKLTVGVKTNTIERKSKDGGGLSGTIGGIGLGGGQNGQGRSGGRQGGGGPSGGRGQGGQRGGPPPGAVEKGNPAEVVLNFWFKPNL
ncbi:hypothetical protein [uncultured Kriegella sp.]|uniref:hypothetical protein n=1 Tax=uncultured Kriegella sp. TaxID=1798910 RepID=UPI0030D7D9D7|tara:strand:+ start:17293 stop:18051 length:759 start_codon:yes stop_codon:yes gene_type:complete